MNKNFIYTNSEETKKSLIDKGFKLLCDNKGLYVFANCVANTCDFSKLDNVCFGNTLKY